MSEFRQDPISRDWVIIAPERAQRPDELMKKRPARKPAPKSNCPFEDLEASGNWPPIASYPDAKHWKIAVIPNKYPALSYRDGTALDIHRGIYRVKAGIGSHELVIGRDHIKNFAALSSREAANLFEIFQDRYRVMGQEGDTEYVSAFCNWGPSAGASLWHPHYQILGLPIVPPHVAHSLHGAETHFKKNGTCIRCEIIKAERTAKKRIIAENKYAIAIAPYMAKRPFEIAILPKAHFAFFEETPDVVVAAVAELTQISLRAVKKYLHDPDFNFFIHSAPFEKGKRDANRVAPVRGTGLSDRRQYAYHHWHVEIVPVNVISPPGGFEIGTVVNINVIDPDIAAAILRGESIRKK